MAGKEPKKGALILGRILTIVAGAIIAFNLYELYSYHNSGFVGKVSKEIQGSTGLTFFFPLTEYEVFVYILWSFGALITGAGAGKDTSTDS